VPVVGWCGQPVLALAAKTNKHGQTIAFISKTSFPPKPQTVHSTVKNRLFCDKPVPKDGLKSRK
jgi:hypothetical protein